MVTTSGTDNDRMFTIHKLRLSYAMVEYRFPNVHRSDMAEFSYPGRIVKTTICQIERSRTNAPSCVSMRESYEVETCHNC